MFICFQSLSALVLLLDLGIATPMGNWQEIEHHNTTLLERSLGAESLFTVRDCSAAQIATIDGWIEEAILLHDAATAAYANFRDDGNGMQLEWILADELFVLNDDEQLVPRNTEEGSSWYTIGVRLAAVSKFLGGGGQDGSTTGKPPYLFCGDSFATYTPWDQPVKNTLGNTVPYTDGSGDVFTVSDVFPEQSIRSKHLPFWVPELEGYIFDTNGATTLCGKNTVYAAGTTPSHPSEQSAVQTGTFDRFFWICPRGFDPTKLNDGITAVPANQRFHGVSLLSSIVTVDGYPVARRQTTSLESLAPISSTFYHELFHLTDAAGTTVDSATLMEDIYSGAEILGTVDNPESYVLFALASYIYSNPPTGSPAVVFPAGFPKTVAQVIDDGGFENDSD